MHLALCASHLGTELAGRYRLERLVGEGASSWVFAGTDLRLEREVAVKLLKPRAEPEQAAELQRFVREGRLLAKLPHPNVVAVHDAGQTSEGHRYLVMELLQAGSLEAELGRRTRLGIEEALQFILPLMGALACAHDRGIIHRDLKPANIALVQHDGRKPRAKLLDFGIARPSGPGASSGGLVGTPAYMAPEQVRSEALGPGTDVWALGVVMFRCLSGRLPFEAGSSAAMLLKLVQERAASIVGVCPGLAPRVAVALDRALEPDPTHRYPDMRTFARVLGLACRQDGVRVETDPEPMGLPDFRAWLENADLETTSPTGPACGGSMQVTVAVATAGAPAHTPWRTALWTAAVLVAFLAAIWSTLSQPVRTRGQASSSGANRRAVQPEHVAEPLPAAPAPSDFVSPTPAPSAPTRRPRARKRAAPATASASSGTERGVAGRVAPAAAATSADGPEHHGIVTDWEW